MESEGKRVGEGEWGKESEGWRVMSRRVRDGE